MKRKKFYVNCDIFDKGLSPKEIAAFAYLSRCADKKGVAFPSVAGIAKNCGMSRSTAVRAIANLQDAGLILKKTAFDDTASGKRRQTSNRYIIFNGDTRICDILAVSHEKGEDVTVSEEINDKYKYINTHLSVGLYEKEEIDRIIEGLYLDSFDDESFTDAVTMAVKEMYTAPFILVDGCRVGQEDVRERLKMLDNDAVNHVYINLKYFGDDAVKKGAYLKACIYNAPLDASFALAQFTAGLRHLKPCTE